MAQIFRPSTNTLARASIVGGALLVAAISVGVYAFVKSPYVSEVGVPRIQPVPFSHKHHVGDDGVDCRYCHTSVEQSAFAGLPSTKICMNCHSQIWADSPMLEPVRQSWERGRPLEWVRVHNLADFVYFDHSIHVKKGVGCATCHGRVDEMPLVWRVNTLYMEWCLECHRNPERYLRPREHVFDMAWQPPADQVALGRRLVQEYKVRDARLLTSCSTCHR
ncbi:MAG: cytochrome c3 family protein [Candidatus Methylomirabilales bacterium]